MRNASPAPTLPRAYDTDSYHWDLRRVPAGIVIDGTYVPNPARRCAVFVVHGMGEQQWTETSATLRSGFEDALPLIREWQEKHAKEVENAQKPRDPQEAGDPEKAKKIQETKRALVDKAPSPFTYDGYWADFTSLEATFPEDWQAFNERERRFFQGLWNRRAYSAMRTYGWFLKQQLRLIIPGRKGVGYMLLAIYLPLQVLFPVVLTAALIRARKIVTHVLADVRMYANPVGAAEYAIVQRIDYRVGREFMRLIGLDWDFRPLPLTEQVCASGAAVVFDRVVWVSHSLGTVISYNVLSDLFDRAAKLESSGDDAQQRGVRKFRQSLCRFVTMGSPLGKFATLFPEALRPWPKVDRSTLLDGGDQATGRRRGGAGGSAIDAREWWINFYHVLDPVSGVLQHPLICGNTPPVSIHTDWRAMAVVPGLAHSSYWSATRVLRFILARVHGRAEMPDEEIRRQSHKIQTWYAVVGYFVWAFLLCGSIVALFHFRSEIIRALWHALKSAGTLLVGG